jgi:hypothetical protein
MQTLFSDVNNHEAIEMSRVDVGRPFSTGDHALAAPGCFQNVLVDCATLLLSIFNVHPQAVQHWQLSL